jgi:hypothetical protein
MILPGNFSYHLLTQIVNSEISQKFKKIIFSDFCLNFHFKNVRYDKIIACQFICRGCKNSPNFMKLLHCHVPTREFFSNGEKREYSIKGPALYLKKIFIFHL